MHGGDATGACRWQERVCRAGVNRQYKGKRAVHGQAGGAGASSTKARQVDRERASGMGGEWVYAYLFI